MRIALVAPLISPVREPHIGGVATLLTDLACGLQAAGHDVHLFAATGSQIDGVHIVNTGVKSEDLAETLFRPLGEPVAEALRSRRAELAGKAFSSVYALIGDGGYDVVHNHSFDAEAIRLAGELTCPVVHSLHLPPDPAMCEAVESAQRGPNPPVVAAVSPSQMSQWQKYNRIDLLLRAGIPVSRIPWSADPGRGLLLAGRISPEKGVLDAIEIAGAAGLELTIAGTRYDEEYARRVDEAAARRGGGVTFAGSLTRNRLWNLMARSSALLFPIRWDEPFGLVSAEAQAAGCPVVGYRRGALCDVIREGVTGTAVEPGDIDAAVAALPRALTFDRAACRTHAEDRLDIAPTIRAHLQLYRRLERRPETPR